MRLAELPPPARVPDVARAASWVGRAHLPQAVVQLLGRALGVAEDERARGLRHLVQDDVEQRRPLVLRLTKHPDHLVQGSMGAGWINTWAETPFAGTCAHGDDEVGNEVDWGSSLTTLTLTCAGA